MHEVNRDLLDRLDAMIDGCPTCYEREAATQPAPIPGRVKVIDRVHQDLSKRSIEGMHKYGTWLMTGNGRDALRDAYEEAMDQVQYLAQAIMEREGL